MTISIITVSYNSGSTIKTTIESVLAQTYKDIEYIIVDGASTDNTMNVVKKYIPLFNEKIKYISEPDKGIYDAMNKGIQMATGDILGILNSDDFFTSNTILENITQCFQKDKKLDAVYGDVHFVKANNLDKCVRYYSSKIFRPALIRFGFIPAHPSFYVNKSCYNKYGLYSLDYKISGDFDLMTRFIYKYKIKIKYLPIDFVTMQLGGVSTSGIKSTLLINKELVKVCKANNIYTNLFILLLRYFYKAFEFTFILKNKL